MPSDQRLFASLSLVGIVSLLFGAFVFFASPAWSQQTAAPPSATSETQIQELVSTLKDDAARQKLVDQLEALLAAQQTAQPQAKEDDLSSELMTEVLGLIEGASGQFSLVASRVSDLPDQAAATADRLAGDQGFREMVLLSVASLMVVLLLGLVAEWIARRLLRHPAERISSRGLGHRQDATGVLLRLLVLFLRLVLDLVPLAIFAAVAYGTLTLTQSLWRPHPVATIIIMAFVNAHVVVEIVACLGRAVLSPDSDRLRVLPLDGEGASYGFFWLRRFTVTAVYGHFALNAALLLGLDRFLYGLLLAILGLVLAAMVVVLILQVRAPVARLIRGSDGAGRLRMLRHRLADVWHIFAIVYVVAFYVVWVLAVPGGFEFLARATILSLLTLAIAVLLSRTAADLSESAFRLKDETAERYPLLQSRVQRYQPVVGGALRAVVWVLALLVLLDIWGAEPFDWLASQAGRSFLGRIGAIVFILAIAGAVWEGLSAVIEGALGRANGKTARMQTLLPLLRNAGRVLILVMTVLIVLSELGIDIAPLLAGAGVIGLAIGFGAQTLVKDVITGIFILLEDLISVGDVVEAGGHSGLVERMSIRTLTLRDLEGNVHSVPFGEIQTVKNLSKDFSYALIEAEVSYREDTDEVVAVMREIAQEMLETEPYKSSILGEFEVLGVDSLGEYSVNIRARFRTKPLAQWGIKREYLRRMKKTFDARNIEIPFPHQTIYFGIDKQGFAPPLRVLEQKEEPPETMPAASRPQPRPEPPPAAMVSEIPGAKERQSEPADPEVEAQRREDEAEGARNRPPR